MTLRVFTDLDGTLLEHESYSMEPALGALQRLQDLNVPLYFNTSKTSAEIVMLQQRLGLSCSYVCENGGALYEIDPGSEKWSKKEFGPPQSRWLAPLHELREREKLSFIGFSDWTARELAEITGLSVDEAAAAKQRDYSEPIQWRGSTANRSVLDQFLEQHELQLQEGGRFFSVQGHFTKQTAMGWLQQRDRNSCITVALGDSPNDQAMLEAATVAVIIRSAKSSRMDISGPRTVIRTSRPGPTGWSEAMNQILDQYERGELLEDDRQQSMVGD